MLYWLLLTVPLGLFLARLHPRIWIKLDVKDFVKNGSANSLLRVFHRQRFTWRAVFGFLICAVAVWPLWGHRWPLAAHWWLLWCRRWPLVLAALSMFTWEGAYWLYYFNPALNIARQLAYVGPYHVSWVADASWLDRRVWAQASRQVYPDFAVVHEPDPAIIAVAGPMYKKLLTRYLKIGATLALLLVAGCILVLVLSA